jgi:hypothetical protein
VLSGRGLCDELITRPEESYRLWCVVVCDLENLKNEEAMTRVGSQRHRKKQKIKTSILFTCYFYYTSLTLPSARFEVLIAVLPRIRGVGWVVADVSKEIMPPSSSSSSQILLELSAAWRRGQFVSLKRLQSRTQRYGVTSWTTRTLDVTIVTEIIQHNR